ncbi:anti-sigma factor [Rhodococcus sp. EPR-134]|uniref:anti-sigma factor n=1 Tax=Rhodococcus sp. EPR-134 TaxID=1813675 RepID=UPI0007BB2B54|nr:anti-sigma factor [Rhodococcus sp. EPR-134]KZF17721.1 anti-sigma factor [Rhodococcus sp. EPR-134]
MDEELIDYAYAYAIDALDLDERREVDRRLAASDSATHAEFDAQVRLTAETMAAMTVVDAVEPPPSLRRSVLASIAEQTAAPNAPVSLAERRNRRRPWTMALAAAAAVAILVGGIGIGRTLSDDTPPQNAASEIMAAPDVHATTRDIPGGGSATTLFSPSEDAAVLVMNDVTPPSPDTVYQMWLVPGDTDDTTMIPMGTMAPGDVKPTTQVVLDGIGPNTKLAFTVEPPGGSQQPTSEPFATIPLI